MSTGVIITSIICGTILALSIISIIGASIKAKKVAKTLNGFKDSWFKEDN